jgi:hypothetical protein
MMVIIQIFLPPLRDAVSSWSSDFCCLVPPFSHRGTVHPMLLYMGEPYLPVMAGSVEYYADNVTDLALLHILDQRHVCAHTVEHVLVHPCRHSKTEVRRPTFFLGYANGQKFSSLLWFRSFPIWSY